MFLKNKNMNALKRNLIFIILVAIALVLLFNKLILWGIAALIAGLVVFGIQQLIRLNVQVAQFQGTMDELKNENELLKTRNEKLAEENSYLKDRQFQITQIKNILELNLFEIDTKFTRSVNKEEKIDNRTLKYFGSLNVSLTAKYGLDIKELRFKYIPENDELIVANINPKFLSFGNRKLEWGFFEIFEFRSQNPLAEKRWMTSDDLSKYAETIKENYRVTTESSLEKGPEEFGWIYNPIRQSMVNAIKILFGGICRNISIAEQPDDTFENIDNLAFNRFRPQNILKEHK